jgi:hypothetical protein
VANQPKDYLQFDHYSFIRNFINPLFTINQQLIIKYKVYSKSFVDYSLNKQATFDNGFYLNIGTGLSYEISKQFAMHLNCSKTSTSPTTFSGIMRYQLHKKLAIKLGFVSNTNNTSLDIAYCGKKMNLALILSFHPSLGITPGTLISTVNE